MPRRHAALLLAGLACAIPRIAGAATGPSVQAPIVPLASPLHSTLQVGGYLLDLGETDDNDPSTYWEGPIVIDQPGGSRCTVSEDVAIVSPPLWRRGTLLLVSTYSGSEANLFVVDARNCAVRWKSPEYVGTASIRDGIVLLPGTGRFTIESDGTGHLAR